MTINTVNAFFDNELVIALMGKGGTGKTFTSLGLIQSLRQLDKATILADADQIDRFRAILLLAIWDTGKRN